MKKNRLIIFTNNQVETRPFMCELLRLGHEDFSAFLPGDLESCQQILSQPFDTQIVLCDNNFLDNLLEKNKQEGDIFELLHDQAVVLRRGEQKMMFAPLEAEPKRFFKEFLPAQEVKIFSIFGKNLASVRSIFDSIRCNYKIITKSPILHTVFCFGDINEEIIKSSFGENLYSFQDESLEQCCARGLKVLGLELAVLEQATAGLLCGKLCEQNPQAVKNAYIMRSLDDFLDFGIQAEVLSGGICKELAFASARELGKKSGCDLTLSVIGEGNRYFISIGKKDEIHVYSTVFDGQTSLDLVTDFALFRLLKTMLNHFEN